MLSLMGKMNMEKTDILRMISGLMPSKINILHLWISLMGNLTLAEQVSSQVGGGESKPDLAMEIKEVLETRVKKLLENQMESESKAVKDSVTMVSRLQHSVCPLCQVHQHSGPGLQEFSA